MDAGIPHRIRHRHRIRLAGRASSSTRTTTSSFRLHLRSTAARRTGFAAHQPDQRFLGRVRVPPRGGRRPVQIAQAPASRSDKKDLKVEGLRHRGDRACSRWQTQLAAYWPATQPMAFLTAHPGRQKFEAGTCRACTGQRRHQPVRARGHQLSQQQQHPSPPARSTPKSVAGPETSIAYEAGIKPTCGIAVRV